jgi:hypothetical protein
MNPFDKIDDPRRRVLIEALTFALVSAIVPARAAAQNVFGSRPSKLPPEQSIYRLSGTVTVNGQAATLQTPIRPGDTVETGENSEVVFVVGGHSMILRARSNLVIEGETEKKATDSMLVAGLRMLTGKLLTVSRGSRTRVSTGVATIGIRGTGWYAEADPDQTYFCTCYGVAEIAAADDPTSTETVATKQHERPLYILREGAAGQRIRNAPFINHTDQELTLIETLVGRTPPFIFPKDEYTGPRREY